ncbi:MAG TPA: ABC transporter substrate-binding protein [Pseudolabrys sp.]|nr:ABC transporter substrate-binding protein [Pseudolabrys sp.]
MRTTANGRRRMLALAALTGFFMSPAGAQELKLWRHGIVEAKSDAGIVFMASKGGFAEKQGLKIEIQQFKGDTLALKALLAGELDSYEGNPGSPMVAASRGADIKLIGCYWPGLTYAIYSKTNINSPADLKGKTFAISAPGALPDLVARAVLAKNNLTAADVKFAIMGSDADRFKALTAGIVDAAAASSGFTPEAEKAGVKLLVHAIDAVPNYIRFCIYSTSKTLAARKDEAVHFLAAEMEGFRYALANRDRTLALTREITLAKPDNPQPAFIYDEIKRLSAVDPDMAIPVNKLAWMRDLLLTTGNLTKPVDLGTFVDGDIRTRALQIAK